MLFKNKISQLKETYFKKNSLATKFSLLYGILLILVLAIALTLGVIGVIYYIKLGINDTEELIEILIKVFLGSFVLGSFLIVLLSPILSKKILKPLEQITKAENKISAENLDKRINYEGNEIELKVLSDSFDSMIQRLENSFNKQSEFISDVSHELKTPIAVISGYASLLERWGKNDKATCDKSIKAIKKETENMNGLVNKLLYITKADTGKVSLNIAKINVKELIDEILEETNLIEKNRNIYSSSNQICYIEADINSVKELIRIFVDNAIKYTKENGNVNIFSNIKDDKVYICVSDDGIGIDEKDQLNIFDRFYRVDKSRSKETGGVGLGLAIAKSIANLNNAKIGLESKTSQGSTFFVVFKEIK